MSLDLFRVAGAGLQINDSVQILEGTGAPSMDAPLGSLYSDITSGSVGFYLKIETGSGAAKWAKITSAGDVSTVISQLQTDLATEIANRIAGDSTLTTNLATEVQNRLDGDAYLQSQINALSSAFNYVGTLAGGTQGTPTDLTALPVGGKDPGDYYKVTTAGYFTDGGAAFYVNMGDGLVWNNSGTVDKIDNTDSQVSGTGSFIQVTGSSDTGYAVDIDDAFKTRVSTLETGLASEITARTAADTAEATARANADTALQTLITDLTGDLAQEVLDRQAADSAEATIRAAADTALQTAITNEATARAAADAAFEVQMLKTTGTQTASDTLPVGVEVAKWIIKVTEGNNTRAEEILAVSNGAAVDYTRYAVVKIGSPVSPFTVNVSLVGTQMVLAVTGPVTSTVIIKRVSVA